MAMNYLDPWNVPININQQEYAIKGYMFNSQIAMTDVELMKINPATFEFDMKVRLLNGLLEEILKGRCIEFTKSQDLMQGINYFRARMFAVPDEQVRILRVTQKNNTPT